MKRILLSVFFVLFYGFIIKAQTYNLPELIYYHFSEGFGNTTANSASPGVGNNPALLTGTTTFGTNGGFGSCIQGDGTPDGGVETGWNCDLGTGDWTISMFLEIPALSSGEVHYLFGDPGSNSFRFYQYDSAGVNYYVLTGGGLNSVSLAGSLPAFVVHFVYDSSVPEIRVYKYGLLISTFPQPALNIPTGSGFKVGGYSTLATLFGKLDEFRLYNRALDSTEIANTWNQVITPVELTSFTAEVNNGNVILQWKTATETNNKGFDVKRKAGNSDWDEIGFVTGHGTVTEKNSYSYIDKNLEPGSYSYKLVQIDFDGSRHESKIINVKIVSSPFEFSLEQNFPNPFNPSTTIEFSIPENGYTTLKIFNILGKEVNILVDEYKKAGRYKINFNGKGLASGIYFYKLNAGKFSSTKKMIYTK